ncbi:MAG: hypothetical protein IJG39_10255 [Synergistaceae bacterium]|nr:hypothetical protein [Synergistaceae bacterium]
MKTVCPVCGYDRPTWSLTLSNSTLRYCENCYTRYIGKSSHIEDFRLISNPERRKGHARA